MPAFFISGDAKGGSATVLQFSYRFNMRNVAWNRSLSVLANWSSIVK